LSGSSASVTGNGAAASGGTVTILASGTYIISGQLSDGQIIVESTDDEVVRLVLNNANITCANSAPIYVKDARKVILILADGTTNTITDGSGYQLTDTTGNEPNAAIFSKADLTINGTGTLNVDANYKQGITSKDELKIVSGTINVDAVTNAINGRDFVAIKDGTLTVNAGNDGIKSNNDEDTALGYVCIEGGTIKVTAGEDGIQGENQVVITNGMIDLITGGGSANGVQQISEPFGRPGSQAATASTDSAEASAKGIKAALAVTINGGMITVDSADDTLHANQDLTINGGSLTLISGDDGIHADSSITINGGSINLTKAYEGIESSLITINNGEIKIVSSDDAINVGGGADGSSINGRPGQNDFASDSNLALAINGGKLVIDAGGDGLDSNGSITMTGGTVLVNGPTNNGNGAIDYNGSFKLTGGFLVAAGSSGMAEAPDSSSTQYSLMVNFSSALAAGTLVNISSATGESIVTFTPAKAFQSIVVSSPAISKGGSYVVSTGGSSTGTPTNGLDTDGLYTGGTTVTTLTASSVVTTYGSTGGPGGGGGPGGFGGGDHPNRPGRNG